MFFSPSEEVFLEQSEGKENNPFKIYHPFHRKGETLFKQDLDRFTLKGERRLKGVLPREREMLPTGFEPVFQPRKGYVLTPRRRERNRSLVQSLDEQNQKILFHSSLLAKTSSPLRESSLEQGLFPLTGGELARAGPFPP